MMVRESLVRNGYSKANTTCVALPGVILFGSVGRVHLRGLLTYMYFGCVIIRY